MRTSGRLKNAYGRAALGALILPFLLGLWLWASSTNAADGLRCKNRLVAVGHTTYDVQALCGPPDHAERHVVTRAVRNQVRGACAFGARCSSAVIDTVDVTIDEWTYDFGTNRLVQYLTFEDGKLVVVRSGNYGHKPPQ